MSGFLTKQFLITLILTTWALPVLAQTPVNNNSDPATTTDRDASFLLSGVNSIPTTIPDFSGLAAAPELISPPAAAPMSSSSAVRDKSIDSVAMPVTVAPLSDVSSETIGTQSAEGFGADMWKGTSQPLADSLISIANVTMSPALNDLMRRLLVTAAVPPEGTSQLPQSLTAMRVDKLLAFGAVADAWSLAKNADVKLMDDITYHSIIENLLASGGEDPCGLLPDLVRTRPTIDWQKDTIICQLRAKDMKGAQVSLDVMRAQPNHDSIFLEVADKNVVGTSKVLPSQLTPLTPTLLALLRMTDIPLPGELYGHPDFSLAAALLHASARQDVAQIGLAERAAERGIIHADDLAAVYRVVVFQPDALGAPLATVETGLRLRALLFHAAENEKDPVKRIAYAVKFVQSAPPELLNGAGPIAAMMVGDVKPDAVYADNAVAIAQISMLAGQGETALAWLKLAQPTTNNATNSQNLWPQFVLAGMESDSGYAADLGKWIEASFKQDNPQVDASKARDSTATTLLLLDAAGFTVPDAAWSKILSLSSTQKHIALSSLLLERLQAASAGGRRAETVLLAVDLASDGDISLTAALAITRALRLSGFKPEAVTFARHAVALLAKSS